jgi:hypothetical protein
MVTWAPEVRLSTKCAISVVDFPFDTVIFFNLNPLKKPSGKLKFFYELHLSENFWVLFGISLKVFEKSREYSDLFLQYL